MSDLQAPVINWQIKAGKSVTGLTDHRALIIGVGSGSSKSKTLVRDIQPNEAMGILGKTSPVYQAYLRFRKYNEVTPLDIVAVKPPGSAVTRSGCTLTFIGTATETRDLIVHVGDDAFVVRVSIATGDTAAAVATKFVAVVTREHPMMTASVVAGGKAKLEYHSPGGILNGSRVTVQNRVAGIAVADAICSGGAASFDVTGIPQDISNIRYHTVIHDDLIPVGTIASFLDARFNSTAGIMGGVGVTMLHNTSVVLKAAGDALNGRCNVILGNPNEMPITAIPLLAASEFGAKRALRLTEGAVLGDIVLDANEAFGGVNKSSLPYHNTPMSYTAQEDRLSVAELKHLTDSGISLIVPSGHGTVLGSIVTQYKHDNSGISDNTFKYLNAVDTSLAVQEYLYNNCQKEFGQTRATGGGLVAGVSMTNELSVKAYLVGLYDDLIEMALVQGGADAKKAFTRDLVVTLDAETGKYRVFAPTAIVSQLRGIDGIVAISYNF